MKRILLLGTGTCELSVYRNATSALIELDDLRVVYDFGRGIALQLHKLGLKSDDIEHIIISHFHADHVSDLIPFFQAASYSRTDPRTKPLNLYGPPGIKALVSGFVKTLGEKELFAGNYKLNIYEIESDNFKIGDRSFDFIELPPAGNHGLRFKEKDKTFALTGDSSFHPEEIAFLKDVALGIFDSGHISDKEIVRLAVATQAEELVCTHLYRELDLKKLKEDAASAGFTGNLKIAKDLMEFYV